MTTHQLWDGGPANSQMSRRQWPAYTFAAADPALAKIDSAVHQAPALYKLKRVLDFKNDKALRDYFNNNAVAASDVLNILLLPAKGLLFGAYVEVEVPADNGTAVAVKLGSAAGLFFGGAAASTAIDCTVASAQWTAPGAAAYATGTGVTANSLATATYVGTQPDMLQLTLSTLAQANLAGFGNLRLNVEAVYCDLGEMFPINF